LLCASSWNRPERGSDGAGPGAGAEQDDGVHLQDPAPNASAAMCGVTADEADEQQAGPGPPEALHEGGARGEADHADEDARPTVSKIQRAGSGIRPKVGRTERSHPKTSPRISAPPLAVRLRGTPPRVMTSAQKTPHDDPQATKTTSVALDGRSMYPRAEPARSTSRLDPARRRMSPVHRGGGVNGISSPPRISLSSTMPARAAPRAR